MFPEMYGSIHRDVQIVTRSGRVAQPPLVDRSFAGIVAREEVHRKNDKILCQLRTTWTCISIRTHVEMHWSKSLARLGLILLPP